MYVELHARSAFSFLQGASLPEELAQIAADRGMGALALLDRDGVYGSPRFHQAAKKLGIKAHIGAEVAVEGAGRWPLLARHRTGYRNLCRVVTRYKLRSKKGEGSATAGEMAEHAEGLVCLTGGDDGPMAEALSRGGMDEARREAERLIATFGRENVYAELQRHYDPAEEARNQAVLEIARGLGLPLLATNGVAHATPAQREVLDVFTCLRNHTTLKRAGRLLSRNAARHLRSPAAMARLFRDLPEAVARTEELSARLDFTLADLGYEFPRYPVPYGETMMSFLRKRTDEGARARYRPYHEKAQKQIERELALIAKLKLAGYFLIVWDIVCYCREAGILIQGRGSAANSAVCYALGITAVDPVSMDLLFERFLSEERGEWPDIDLDLPSGDQREKVIQHVYERYGQLGAAMTANVITYRGRSAVREVGKVLDFAPEDLGRLSSLVSRFEWKDPKDTDVKAFRVAGFDLADPRIVKFLQLYRAVQDLPRHLGQHSGGMVVCQGQLDAVVPLEPASMPGRVVVQWDKDDCADVGIVKVDLLGLGMMAVLEESIALIRDAWGEEVDLAHLPPDDPEVYAALQKADTVGLFQVESRAQMSCLPRLKPKSFYDIVVEVAIIRPGPIVGNMVHPYLKRRAGREEPVCLHPSLEPVLRRTLGVPLFQEQLLRMAMIAAGFSGGEAEELRRAFGFKRSERRMKDVEVKLRRGMDRNGITGQTQDAIVKSITSFALYGFPESHAASFALLAYASAWLKCRYPAAFTAALLNNQPMGFYHPATLVKDAQRHGVRLRPVDVARSQWNCTIEVEGDIRFLRLGLRYVRGLRAETGKAIVAERERGPYAGIDDLARRVGTLRKDEMATLAEAGALNFIRPEAAPLHRRDALWHAARAMRPPGEMFSGSLPEEGPSPLPPMTPDERLEADYRDTGLTIGPHPMAARREELRGRGVLRAVDLLRLPDGLRVKAAGAVICRQRPGTAKGFMFLSLEDETGIANAIVTPDLFDANRAVLVGEPFIIVDGLLQHQDGVVSVKVQRVEACPRGAAVPSHDFR
jgi:error-prone DNA polymerase